MPPIHIQAYQSSTASPFPAQEVTAPCQGNAQSRRCPGRPCRSRDGCSVRDASRQSAQEAWRGQSGAQDESLGRFADLILVRATALPWGEKITTIAISDLRRLKRRGWGRRRKSTEYLKLTRPTRIESHSPRRSGPPFPLARSPTSK